MFTLLPERLGISANTLRGDCCGAGRKCGRLRRIMSGRIHCWAPGRLPAKLLRRPYYFDEPEKLTDWLRGAKTLFNTYWIRFEHGEVKFEQAVQNTPHVYSSVPKRRGSSGLSTLA